MRQLPCKRWHLYVRPETGYGVKVVGGRRLPAHRWVYCQERGLPYESIAGLVVMHTCDNPACVEPTHLVLGTQAQNLADCHRKGRARKASRESSGMAKLTEYTVSFIRAHYIRGDATFGQSALARQFGVSQSSISRVLKGETW